MRVDSRQNHDHILAEAMPDGIVALSRDGHILWWNSVARRLLGLRKDVDMSKDIKEIITADQLQKHFFQEQSDAIKITSPSFPDVMLEIAFRPYQQNQRLLIVKDITHTHLLESMREDFIANVSHELRTPLTVFQGYLELLKDGGDKLDEQHFAKVIEQMSEQSERMSRLVRDLLWLSRLEGDVPNAKQHQHVPVQTLLKNICDDARRLSGDKKSSNSFASR